MRERFNSASTTTPSPPSSKFDIGARLAQARSSALTTTTAVIPHPTFEEAIIGQVFFLPAQAEISTSSKAYQKYLGNIWEHPVVVISKNLEEKTVDCLICTSFTRCGSNGILYTKKSLASRKQHLLCENTDKKVSTHDGTQLLTMKAGSEIFSKATYVNTVNDSVTIEYYHLKQYKTGSGKAIIFSEESMALLS
ncbi:hypothetical protein DM02DRAFT_648356 [Periconia macrospinosa]|uniref:Uncharacterized protein n=1 Tax=Periconia macrospinosa TaxID=97972 RepID=A0A2V1EB59_9PLEO|nr:hypothetical protein DM02DRAFT_648356 [Periconia macrospinosa]